MVTIKKKTNYSKIVSYMITLFVITFIATFLVTSALLPKNVFAFSGDVKIELTGQVTGMVPYSDCNSNFYRITEPENNNYDWDIGLLEFQNAGTPIIISIKAKNLSEGDVIVWLTQPKTVENLNLSYSLNGESFTNLTQEVLLCAGQVYDLSIEFSVMNSSVSIDNAIINFALDFEAV